MLKMRVSFNCLSSVSSCINLCVSNISLSIAGSASSVQIHWYIMTSPFTDEATRKFFESHKFFGLEAEQVNVFKPLSCTTSICLFLQWFAYLDSPLWYRLPFSSKGPSHVFPRMVDLLWRLHTRYVSCPPFYFLSFNCFMVYLLSSLSVLLSLSIR